MFEMFLSLLLSLSVTAQGVMFPFSFWKSATGSSGGGLITDVTCNGTLTTDGNFKVCDYTVTTDNTFAINTGTGNLRILCIAAGGGGGGGFGLPGGAGGLRELTLSYGPGTYNLHVGIRANGAASSQAGTNGDDSFFDSTSCTGGGGGSNGGHAAKNGGSGGAGGADFPTPGTGIAGQGFRGGNGDPTDGTGGGGGGCGAVGADGTSSAAGDGGVGCNSDILVAGVNVCYAGGGNNPGGGSSSCGASNSGALPTDNTGAGGNGQNSPGSPGRVAASGRIVLRWQFQ